jgi:hypothetical protein
MIGKVIKIGLFVVLIANPSQLFAQSLGCWNTLNLSFDNGKKWSYAAEFQLRSLQFYKNYNYNEYKGIVNYKILPNLQTSMVIGRYTTFGQGKTFQNPKLAEEFRVALQIGLKNNIGKVQIDHRYRFEKRYYTSGARGVRLRYRVGISQPIDRKKLTSINFSNEFLIAVNSGTALAKFDKNRLAFSVTQKLNQTLSMQLGYLSQYDSKSADEPGNNFLVYSIFLNLSKLNAYRLHHSDN